MPPAQPRWYGDPSQHKVARAFVFETDTVGPGGAAGALFYEMLGITKRRWPLLARRLYYRVRITVATRPSCLLFVQPIWVTFLQVA
ncbi:hypothetical protein DWV00_11895 [Trinickia dinghuensis]|uniref:Uncharacterized protein n=1 Tax=Trinickia dinghuensis TaxID=2291023 RepID=A0A3D8K0Y2_9BURK|nr:hypothetical protein DWV00_11895 [Trinickia dinghuensis]